MGDLCDMRDVERFMRSAEGSKALESLKNQLLGKRITDVTFSNEIFGIMTTLHLDDGETFVVLDLSLTVETLRDEFAEAIEQEYYKDYPERKPSSSARTDRPAQTPCAGRWKGGQMSKRPEALPAVAGNCPYCGGHVEYFPDQDDSCDYHCTRCGWHQHVPSDDEIAQVRNHDVMSLIVNQRMPASLKVDLKLLKQQAAILGKAVDKSPLTDDERLYLEGLWEFVHSVIDRMESIPPS